MKTRLLLAGTLILIPLAVAGQGSTPTWAKPDLFWYYRNVSGSSVWLQVDAVHGVREPLFDHQRLATELSLETGVEFTRTTLPFADPAMQFVVKYDGSNAYIQEGAMAVEFIFGNYHWRCDLQIKWNWNLVPPTDYECQSRRPVVPGQSDVVRSGPPAPRVSPDKKWEAIIENHNVAVRAPGATTSIVLSSDGTERAPYHHGSLRWSADSKTLGAYKVDSEVWLSDNIFGTVTKQVVKAEWTAPFTKR